MPRSNWTPSIVPDEGDQTVYLVADDFGREADYETTDLEAVLQNLMTGQYSNPFRVVAFNTAERWSQGISEDVANELHRRCDCRCANFHLRSLISWSATRSPIGAN